MIEQILFLHVTLGFLWRPTPSCDAQNAAYVARQPGVEKTQASNKVGFMCKAEDH